MAEVSAVDTLITRLRDGTAPEQLRSAAARGALPLGRAELTRLAVLLLDDPVDRIREDAAASLTAMPDEHVLEVLGDRECPPEVMTHFAVRALESEPLAERIAFHPAVPTKALLTLASRGTAATLELVLTNQERLLAAPAILDRLAANPALRADQRSRLFELLERSTKIAEREAPGRETDEVDVDIDMEETARLLEVDVGELYAASEIAGGEEFERSDAPEVRNAYRKILTLNTGQRTVLAMRGGRDERAILIRDTNKLVALAVLRNGRLTDGEVERIAAMRNVTQDVLRTVGSSREWVKSYAIVRNLVHNPRTPPGIATSFVSRLNDRDLKMLSRDKNVSELIRRTAKKTMDTRSQRKSKGFRKKH